MTPASWNFHSLMLACLLLCASETRGATILFDHTGATDPTAEGWTAPPAGVLVGPILNDLGSGIDAWTVDDNGNLGLYNQVPSPSQIADASSQGWHLRSRLRVVDVPDSNDFSVDVGYRNGTRIYSMGFGSTAAGDPTVRLFGHSTITLTGLGGGYHLYDLIFDSGAESASLFVDGVLQDSGYIGQAQTPVGVFFGSGQTSSTGQGNYALVQFAIGEIVDSPGSNSVLPEPGSFVLLVFGLWFLVSRHRYSMST